jgi:hypothetical protein
MCGAPSAGRGGGCGCCLRRLHTSAYVSIRQHTSAYVCTHLEQGVAAAAAAACVDCCPWINPRCYRCQHTSAYVSIQQHTSARTLSKAWRRPRLLPASTAARGLIHDAIAVSIRQHTSACVSIRQHTSAYVSIRQHTSAYGSIRQHTAADVSIRQQTSAYVSIRVSCRGIDARCHC